MDWVLLAAVAVAVAVVAEVVAHEAAEALVVAVGPEADRAVAEDLAVVGLVVVVVAAA